MCIVIFTKKSTYLNLNLENNFAGLSLLIFLYSGKMSVYVE